MPPLRSYHVFVFFLFIFLVVLVFCGDGNGVPDTFFVVVFFISSCC